MVGCGSPCREANWQVILESFRFTSCSVWRRSKRTSVKPTCCSACSEDFMSATLQLFVVSCPRGSGVVIVEVEDVLVKMDVGRGRLGGRSTRPRRRPRGVAMLDGVVVSWKRQTRARSRTGSDCADGSGSFEVVGRRLETGFDGDDGVWLHGHAPA